MSDVVVPLRFGSRLGVSQTMVVRLFGGLVLGVLARAWMQFISEDPEFTWNGTRFIVSGFAVFGLTQSLVAVARGRVARRRTLTVVQGIATLPLFVAAGAGDVPDGARCGAGDRANEVAAGHPCGLRGDCFGAGAVHRKRSPGLVWLVVADGGWFCRHARCLYGRCLGDQVHVGAAI